MRYIQRQNKDVNKENEIIQRHVNKDVNKDEIYKGKQRCKQRQ